MHRKRLFVAFQSFLEPSQLPQDEATIGEGPLGRHDRRVEPRHVARELPPAYSIVWSGWSNMGPAEATPGKSELVAYGGRQR